jgi:hypothetical protein
MIPGAGPAAHQHNRRLGSAALTRAPAWLPTSTTDGSARLPSRGRRPGCPPAQPTARLTCWQVTRAPAWLPTSTTDGSARLPGLAAHQHTRSARLGCSRGRPAWLATSTTAHSIGSAHLLAGDDGRRPGCPPAHSIGSAHLLAGDDGPVARPHTRSARLTCWQVTTARSPDRTLDRLGSPAGR